MPNDEPIATYAKPSLQQWGWIACGAGFAGVVVYDLMRLPDRPASIVHAVFFAISMACFLAAYATVKWKATFYADRVEWSGAFGRARRLFANEIVGFRRVGWNSLRLVPKRGHRAIMVPDDVIRDEVPFVEELTDLDAADRQAMRRKALSRSSLGTTTAERETFVEGLPRRLRWLNWAGWLPFAWAILWPHPRELVVACLIAAPAVALAVMIWARPLVSVTLYRRSVDDIRLFDLFTWPSIALGLRGLGYYGHLSYGPMLLTAFAGGLAVLALIVWLDPLLRKQLSSLAVAALACTSLSLGLLVHANTMLDTAPAERFTTTVAKSPHPGQDKNEVVVAPWGDRRSENKIRGIPHDTLAVGDRICIDLHPGALGLRWYEAKRCE